MYRQAKHSLECVDLELEFPGYVEDPNTTIDCQRSSDRLINSCLLTTHGSFELSYK
jgi:hypothetical protein